MLCLELFFAASDFEQLDVEHEGGAAGNDATGAAVTVAQVRRDRQLALLANAHVLEALDFKVYKIFARFRGEMILITWKTPNKGL